MIRKLVLVSSLVALVLVPVVPADDWGHHRKNPENTAGHSGQDMEAWAYDVGVTVDSKLVPVNGTVYFYDTDGRLNSFDPEEGERNWVYEGGGSPDGTPIVNNGTVYAESEDGVVALEANTGDIRWRFPTEPLTKSPVARNNTVYIGGEGGIRAVRSDNGEVRWSGGDDTFILGSVKDGIYGARITEEAEERVPEMISEAVENQSEVGEERPDFINYGKYVDAGEAGFYMQALSLDGENRWIFPDDIPITRTAVTEDSVLFSSLNYTLYSLEPDSGSTQWKFSTAGNSHSMPAYYNGKIYITTSSGNIYALDEGSGDIVWDTQAEIKTRSRTAFSEGTMYATPYIDHDSVYAYDTEDGELEWSATLNDDITTKPTAVGSSVLVGSGTRIYSIQNGEVRSPIRVVDEVTAREREEDTGTERELGGQDTETREENNSSDTVQEREEQVDNASEVEETIEEERGGSLSIIAPLIFALVSLAVIGLGYAVWWRTRSDVE